VEEDFSLRYRLWAELLLLFYYKRERMFGKGHTAKESVTKSLNLKKNAKTVPKA